jgi:hypothetical protein
MNYKELGAIRGHKMMDFHWSLVFFFPTTRRVTKLNIYRSDFKYMT